MWASEMANHCGINTWKVNSFIVHATASATDGKFAFQRVNDSITRSMFPVFSHEPTVVRGPSGEWVLYWSTYPNGHTLGPPCTNCTDGYTPPGCGSPHGGSPPTFMSWSLSPEGPWSTPVAVLAAPWDTNLAGVILTNGSFLGVARRSGMPVYLVTATNWKNVSSYQYHDTQPLFNLPPKISIEDGNVYLDSKGRFHAIFHAGLNGIHTFSADGVEWVYGGVAWDNVVNFTDGGTYVQVLNLSHDAYFASLICEPSEVKTRSCTSEEYQVSVSQSDFFLQCANVASLCRSVFSVVRA